MSGESTAPFVRHPVRRRPHPVRLNPPAIARIKTAPDPDRSAARSDFAEARFYDSPAAPVSSTVRKRP
jgi:hypothetical protein